MHRLGFILLALAAALPVPGAQAQGAFGGLAPQTRLTQQGPDGDPTYDATAPDVAYNSRRDEFLVVWHGQDPRAPGKLEIFGRRIGRDGSPAGPAVRITSVSGDLPSTATDPAIAYDFERDRYAVVFEVYDAAEEEAAVKLMLLDAEGRPQGSERQMSSFRSPAVAGDVDVAFNPLADRWLVVFADIPPPYTTGARATGRLAKAATGEPVGEPQSLGPQDVKPLGIASDPGAQRLPRQWSIVWRPDDRYVVSWVEETGGAHPGVSLEVYLLREAADGLLAVDVATDHEDNVAVLGGRVGLQPALAAHPSDPRVLMAYVWTEYSEEPVGEGPEVLVRAIEQDGSVGPARRVSSAGPPATGNDFTVARPAIAYGAASDLFLVTWQGTDDDRPGMAASEHEISGQMVDPTGNRVGAAFTISRMGLRGSEEAAPDGTGLGVAYNGRSGEFLVAWSGDDARPPMAPGEHEVWGRRVGAGAPRDDDQDGVLAGADCDDTDPEVRPGAQETAYNRIDEDCSGADLLDFDADGHEQPADCDDTRVAVHPGAFDIPGNGRDEDCRGGDAVRALTVRVRATWLFGGRTTSAARLVVEGAPRGARIVVGCRGGGCPRRLRAGRAVAARTSTVRLSSLLGGAALRARAQVTVRVEEPGAGVLTERFTMRAGKAPRHTRRCRALMAAGSTACR